MIGLSNAQTRLERLEHLEQRRHAEALLEEFRGLLESAGAHDWAVAAVFWFLLATRPPGPTVEDLEAVVRLLRKQAVARHYRPMLYRAQVAIAATEAKRFDPLFDKFFEWFGVDDAPGAGRYGSGLTW